MKRHVKGDFDAGLDIANGEVVDSPSNLES